MAKASNPPPSSPAPASPTPAKNLLQGKYELGRLLGRGTFAKVYRARALPAGDPVAVKVLSKSSVLTAAMAPRVLQEITAMRLLRHPNILRLHEVLATKSRIFLVMDLAAGGDLLSRLCSLPRRRLPESAARRIFAQLVSALRYCHARGVAHRDVKLQNILLDTAGNVLVSDFGLSALPESRREDDGLLHTACGTPGYAAPEVLRHKGYDGAKADAWSCGVILFVLLAGALPFDDGDIIGMFRKMQRREYVVPPWVSPTARRLLARLLEPEPARRPGLEELAGHPWLKRSLSLDSQLSELLPAAGAVSSSSAFTKVINAFDIIGLLSPGLNLSGLVVDGRRKHRQQFTATETPERILDRIGVVGLKLGFAVVDPDRKGAGVRCSTGGRCSLEMSVEMFEVSAPVVLVAMQVESGDVGEEPAAAGGGFVWAELRVELADVVQSWLCTGEE